MTIAVDPRSRVGARPRRVVRVEPIWGTVVGVDIRDDVTESEARPVLDRFFETLRDVDRRFSPWRPESEISTIAAGTIAEADASPDARFVLSACDHLAAASGGAFDARHAGRDGGLDPSGFVKGWAIEEAAWPLAELGLRNLSINAGGDILASGRPEPAGAEDAAWRVGIRHPDQRDRVAAVLGLRDLAIATSGLYERGDHIRDPRTSKTPRELRSLSVVGPSLAWADAYATAGFVMGFEGLEWVAAHAGYGALAITAAGRVVWTSVVAALLRRAPAFSRSSQPQALE